MSGPVDEVVRALQAQTGATRQQAIELARMDERQQALKDRVERLEERVGNPQPLTGQVRENRDQRLQWAAVAAALLLGAGLLSQAVSCRSKLTGEAPVVHDDARAEEQDGVAPGGGFVYGSK